MMLMMKPSFVYIVHALVVMVWVVQSALRSYYNLSVVQVLVMIMVTQGVDYVVVQDNQVVVLEIEFDHLEQRLVSKQMGRKVK